MTSVIRHLQCNQSLKSLTFHQMKVHAKLSFSHIVYVKYRLPTSSNVDRCYSVDSGLNIRYHAERRVIERRLKKISRRQRKKEKDECTVKDGSTVEQYGLQHSRSGGTTRLCTTDNHACIISLRLF